MILLLLLHSAPASRLLVTKGLPAFDTSFGRMSGEDVYLTCRGRDVFVGTVTGAGSFWFPAADAPSREMWTNTVFLVEADLSDSVANVVPLPVQGGRIPNGASVFVASYTSPRLGGRYLMSVSSTPTPHPQWPPGTRILSQVVELPSDLRLPDEATLRAEFAALCPQVGIDRRL